MKYDILVKTCEILAQYEVEKLKGTGFILDKEIFSATNASQCIYGQRFGMSNKSDAHTFQDELRIPRLFGIDNLRVTEGGYLTALEALTAVLWNKDKKDQVYAIVEQFAEWTKVIDIDNLFTL